MKNTIVQHGLSKTRMSVFNSDNRTHGILSLTQIKDAGFALVEFTKKPDFEKLTDLALPLFIRYFSHEA